MILFGHMEVVDGRMMQAGYFLQAGETPTMETVLCELLQNPTAKRLMSACPGRGAYKEGVLLRLYNRTHPATAIRPDEMPP